MGRSLTDIKDDYVRLARELGQERFLESALHGFEDALAECQPFDLVVITRRLVELKEFAHGKHFDALATDAGELIDDVANYAAANCLCSYKHQQA